jgi:predicted  nucleic acid-binding Zn-ribbon protein
MAEHGRDLERHKAMAEEQKAQLDQLQARLAEADEELAALHTVDVEGLQQEVKSWQSKAKKLEQKSQADLAALRFDHALEKALDKFKSKNNKAVRALLDLDKVTLEGDQLVGLDEQMQSLQEQSPYLFEENTSAGGFAYTPAKGSGTPDMSLLSDDEFYRLVTKKQ